VPSVPAAPVLLTPARTTLSEIPECPPARRRKIFSHVMKSGDRRDVHLILKSGDRRDVHLILVRRNWGQSRLPPVSGFGLGSVPSVPVSRVQFPRFPRFPVPGFPRFPNPPNKGKPKTCLSVDDRIREMTNTLWIGANLLFNLATGETTQVFQFVFHEEDATTFSEANARDVLFFVQSRAAKFGSFVWSIDRSSLRRSLFVIKGVQEVE
jgi:hypothetical protein